MKTRVMKKKSSAGHTKRSRKARRSLSWKAMVVAGIVLGGSAWAVTRFREDGGFLRPAVKVPAPEEVPSIDPERMEKRVVQRVEAARAKVLADRSSGEAWGNYGIVLDAHEIYEPAVFAYRTAYALEPKDFRWPYLLARVIKFTDGDDSPEIVGFYEAAMKIRPDYAPLQVRYGDALMRLNRVEDARKAYERALK